MFWKGFSMYKYFCYSVVALNLAACGYKSNESKRVEAVQVPSNPSPPAASLAASCLTMGGNWNGDDCNDIPKPSLPSLWSSFEEKFSNGFDANVTGQGLKPYIQLYVIPELGKKYSCDEWKVKAGYYDSLERKNYKSIDCIFVVNSIAGKECNQGLQVVTIGFRLFGNGVWTSADGFGKGVYRLSDAEISQSVEAFQQC